MSKSYKPWTQDQQFLLPPSLRHRPSEGHLAWFVFDGVSQLDMSPITHAIEAKDARGRRPYHLQMMVALLVYAYCTGAFSSSRIEPATYTELSHIQDGLTDVLGYSSQSLARRLILSGVNHCPSRSSVLIAESSC